MRPDELFVKDRLVEFLGGKDAVLYSEGEDPPDCYLYMDRNKVAVEITQLSPVTFNGNGQIENRITQDEFGSRICDDLNDQFKDDIRQTLLLHLKIPVKNTRKFKKGLHRKIGGMLQAGAFSNEWQKIDINDEYVEGKFVPPRPYSGKKVVGIIENTNADPHILTNAKIIIDNRISIKEKKCEALQFKGPRWLALLNQYWLSDIETYKQAIGSSCIKHNFEKIFLILDTGEVVILFEN